MSTFTDYVLVLGFVLSAVKSQGPPCCLTPENGTCSVYIVEPMCSGAACEIACGGSLDTVERRQYGGETWSGRVRAIGNEMAPSYLLAPFQTLHGRRLLWGERKNRNVLRSAPLIGFLYSMSTDEDYGYDDDELKAETAALAELVASNADNIALLAESQAQMQQANLEMERRVVKTFERVSAKMEAYRGETQSSMSSLIKEAAVARSERAIIRQETSFLLKVARQEAIGRTIALNPLCRKFIKIDSLRMIDPDIDITWETQKVSFLIVSWGFARYARGSNTQIQGALVNVTVTKQRSVASYLLESDQSLWSHTAEIIAFGNSAGGFTYETACNKSIAGCTMDYVTSTYEDIHSYIGLEPVMRSGQLKGGRVTPFKPFDGNPHNPCASEPSNFSHCGKDGEIWYSSSNCSLLFGETDCNAKQRIMGAKKTTVFLPAEGLSIMGYQSVNAILGNSWQLEEVLSLDGYNTGQYTGGGYAYMTNYFDPYTLAEAFLYPDFPVISSKVRSLMEFGGDSDNIVFGIYGSMQNVVVGEVEGTGQKLILEPLTLSGYSANIVDGIQGLRPFSGWVKTDDCNFDVELGVSCHAIGFGPLISNIPYISTALNQTSQLQMLIQKDLSDSAILAEAANGIARLNNETALRLSELYEGLNESERMNRMDQIILAGITNSSIKNSQEVRDIVKRIESIEGSGRVGDWLVWTFIASSFVLSTLACVFVFMTRVKGGMQL